MPGAAPHDQVTVELTNGSTIAGEPVKRALKECLCRAASKYAIVPDFE